MLVDLHTFSAPGVPFVFFGPANNQDELEPFSHAADEERLAQAIGPQRLVYGWLSAYAKGVRRRQNGSIAYGIGTTEYMRAHGGYAVTVECGQHLDPEAPAVARAAIDNTLRLLGLGGLADEDEKDVRTAHAAETGTPPAKEPATAEATAMTDASARGTAAMPAPAMATAPATTTTPALAALPAPARS